MAQFLHCYNRLSFSRTVAAVNGAALRKLSSMSFFLRWFQIPLLALFFLQTAAPVRAQGNYEVQVYGSEMVPPERTMVELHSNFTFEGSKDAVDGVLPDEHALHETIEITQGFTPWFETGFYIFMS